MGLHTRTGSNSTASSITRADNNTAKRDALEASSEKTEVWNYGLIRRMSAFYSHLNLSRMNMHEEEGGGGGFHGDGAG